MLEDTGGRKKRNKEKEIVPTNAFRSFVDTKKKIVPPELILPIFS